MKLLALHTMQAIGAPDVGEWLTSHPATLPQEKHTVPTE